jgi:hypothetical protein
MCRLRVAGSPESGSLPGTGCVTDERKKRGFQMQTGEKQIETEIEIKEWTIVDSLGLDLDLNLPPHLSQQQHRLRLGESPGCEPVEIHTTRHACSIPRCSVHPGLLSLINENGYFSSEQIIHCQPHMATDH